MSILAYKLQMRQCLELKKRHMEKTAPTSNMSDYETEDNYGRSFGGQYDNNREQQVHSTNNDDDGEWDDGETTTPTTAPAAVLSREIQKYRPPLTMKIPNSFDMNVALNFAKEVLPKLENAPYMDVVCVNKYFLKAYEYQLDIFENKSPGSEPVSHKCDEYFKELINFSEPKNNQSVNETFEFSSLLPKVSTKPLYSVRSLLQQSSLATQNVVKPTHVPERKKVVPRRISPDVLPPAAPFKKLKIIKYVDLLMPIERIPYEFDIHIPLQKIQKKQKKQKKCSGDKNNTQKNNISKSVQDLRLNKEQSSTRKTIQLEAINAESKEAATTLQLMENSSLPNQEVATSVSIMEGSLVPNRDTAASVPIMEHLLMPNDAAASVPNMEASLVPNREAAASVPFVDPSFKPNQEAASFPIMDHFLMPNDAVTSMPIMEGSLVPNQEAAASVQFMEPSFMPNRGAAASVQFMEPSFMPNRGAAASVPVMEPSLMPNHEATLVPNQERAAVRTIIEKDWFEILRDRNISIDYRISDIPKKRKRPRKVKKVALVNEPGTSSQYALSRKAAMEHPLCGILLPAYDVQSPKETSNANATFVINTSKQQKTNTAEMETDQQNISQNIADINIGETSLSNTIPANMQASVDTTPTVLKEFFMPIIQTMTGSNHAQAVSKYTQFVVKHAESIAFIEKHIDLWHSIMSGYDPTKLYTYYDPKKLLARDPNRLQVEFSLIQEIIRRPYFDIKRCSFIKTETDAVIAAKMCQAMADADIITFNNEGIVSLKTY